MKLNNIDIAILNKIQYEFPIDEKPYSILADELGISTSTLLNKLKLYRKLGIIKNLGYQIFYKSMNLTSALIGCKIHKDHILNFAKIIRRRDDIKHCYLRNHENYNVWFTIKAKNEVELINKVKELCVDFSNNYIILRSLWTCKLSVKYDLARGLSWSKPQLIKKNVSNILDPEIKELASKIKFLPIEERPYRLIGEELNLDEKTIIIFIKELINKHIIIDWGATLDGENIGFLHNAMVMVEGDEALAKKIALCVHEATHVVLRDCICGNWNYNIYFMIHGLERRYVDETIDVITAYLKIDDYIPLYSIQNLKR